MVIYNYPENKYNLKHELDKIANKYIPNLTIDNCSLLADYYGYLKNNNNFYINQTKTTFPIFKPAFDKVDIIFKNEKLSAKTVMFNENQQILTDFENAFKNKEYDNVMKIYNDNQEKLKDILIEIADKYVDTLDPNDNYVLETYHEYLKQGNKEVIDAIKKKYPIFRRALAKVYDIFENEKNNTFIQIFNNSTAFEQLFLLVNYPELFNELHLDETKLKELLNNLKNRSDREIIYQITRNSYISIAASTEADNSKPTQLNLSKFVFPSESTKQNPKSDSFPIKNAREILFSGWLYNPTVRN